MAIASPNSRNKYTGNGSLATYAYTFKIFKAQHLKVVKRNLDNIETVLTLGVDYTVSGIGNANGGNITLVAGNLPTDYVLAIVLNPEFIQETEFDNGGAFYPETHEKALDKLAQLSITLKDRSDRSIKLPESINASEFDPTLPTAIGPYRLLMVNESGTGFAAGPTPQELSDAAEAAIGADESAQAAAASALAAATSATNSSNSATASASSAVESATHATESQSHASNAATSASAAAGSANAASSFADLAAEHDILYGTGVPGVGLGVNGNSYIDQATGTFYKKESGTWNVKVTLTGSGGVSSFNSRSGAVVPQAGDYNKTMVGLPNVDNTSDVNKPISTATQTALDLKANDADLDAAAAAILDLQAQAADLQDQIDNFDPGTSSPLTTKGDIYVHDGTQNQRLPVGTNGQVLVADSAETAGLKWAAAPSGLPGITPVTDEGKVLMVVSGVAAWAAIPSNAPTIFGTFGSPRNIQAAGITSAASHMSSTALEQIIFVRSNTADTEMDITGNPQITAHTVVGAKMRIVGTDSTRPVLLEDGNGLKLNGQISLNANSSIDLFWDGTAYAEITRRP